MFYEKKNKQITHPLTICFDRSNATLDDLCSNVTAD